MKKTTFILLVILGLAQRCNHCAAGNN